MRTWCVRLLAAGVIFCAVAVGQDAPGSESNFDKTTFEIYVRHLFAWGPDIKVEIGEPRLSAVKGLREVTVLASAGGASLEQTFFVSADGKKIIRGAMYDLEQNPFKSELDKLASLNGPSLGTPGAPVVLVLFTDFQCPYCREMARILKDNLLKTYPKQVRLYLQEFPLEQIHPWAKDAALAGRCFNQQSPELFWRFHDWIFEHQAEITPSNLKEKVLGFAETAGADLLQLNRCLDSRMMEGEVMLSVELARSLQLNSTPTLFINGRRIVAQVGWEQLRSIIDSEIEYQKTAKNAGDTNCCEVSLPSPLLGR